MIHTITRLRNTRDNGKTFNGTTLQFICKITDWSILAAQSYFTKMALVAKGYFAGEWFSTDTLART